MCAGLTWRCVYVCAFSGAFTDEGQRRNQAFVLLFTVFDESKTWYGEVGERKSRDKFKRSDSRKEYHTINGYINATLPGNHTDCIHESMAYCSITAVCSLHRNSFALSDCVCVCV